VRYDYDGLNRLRAVNRDGKPEIRYAYDTRGRTKSIAVGDTFQCGYHYDFLGRPASIETPAGRIAISYDKRGELTIRLPNGLQTVRRFDAEGRVKSITHSRGPEQLLAKFTYGYRPMGYWIGRRRNGQRERTQMSLLISTIRIRDW